MPGVEADALDPLECRRYVEERFSAERMGDYEAAPAAMLARAEGATSGV